MRIQNLCMDSRLHCFIWDAINARLVTSAVWAMTAQRTTAAPAAKANAVWRQTRLDLFQ
jgi:hypothetical protein